MENSTGKVESGRDSSSLIYPWRKEPEALLFVCIKRGEPRIASCEMCRSDCPDYTERGVYAV